MIISTSGTYQPCLIVIVKVSKNKEKNCQISKICDPMKYLLYLFSWVHDGMSAMLTDHCPLTHWQIYLQSNYSRQIMSDFLAHKTNKLCQNVHLYIMSYYLYKKKINCYFEDDIK